MIQTTPNTAAKPIVLIIHGAWHSPVHWQPLMSVLEAQGYPTVCPTLPSIDASPPTVDLPDDAKLIRSQLQRLVEDEQKEVVVVVHSYGGVVGSEAITQDLGAEQRGRQGLDGGVIRLLYICAFVVPVSHSLAGAVGGTLPPWIQIQEDGSCTVADPPERFYHDLTPADQAHWTSLLKPHCAGAQFTPTANAAFEYIPSTYLYCENDQALPLFVQQMMVRNSGVDFATETCSASHSPFLSQVDFVAAVVRRAAGEIDEKSGLNGAAYSEVRVNMAQK